MCDFSRCNISRVISGRLRVHHRRRVEHRIEHRDLLLSVNRTVLAVWRTMANAPRCRHINKIEPCSILVVYRYSPSSSSTCLVTCTGLILG